MRQPGDLEKQSAREPVDLGHDPGPRETAFQNRPESKPLQILLDIVNRTVWDQEIFKFQIIRIEIAEEKSIAAKARQLEIEEVKRGRILKREERKNCFLKALTKRFIEVTIIETSSLAVEIAELRRAREMCEIVIEDLLVGVQLEIAENEKLREEERRKLDLAALQLSGTHILRKRMLSRKSRYKVRIVQGSCVTCTVVGVGDSFSKRRSCVDGAHPPHRTAEENFSSLTRVVEICPLAKNPLPLMKAKADIKPDGVRMIGANIHASQATEYIKMRVMGEDRMALKDGPDYGTSSEVGLSMVAETPEDTANRTTRNSEGGNGQGSAALLSEPPISNHSRALGGAAKLR